MARKMPTWDKCDRCGLESPVRVARCLACHKKWRLCVYCWPSFAGCGDTCHAKHQSEMQTWAGRLLEPDETQDWSKRENDLFGRTAGAAPPLVQIESLEGDDVLQQKTFDDYMTENAFIKAFIKGPSGTGKTYLASAISHLGKTLYIAAEGGLVSARDVVNKGNIVIADVKDSDPNKFFDNVGEALGEAMSDAYECVVVDSMTEVGGKMEDQYAQGTDGKVTIQDWFLLIGRMKKFAKHLRDMPKHTVVTAITKPTGKEDDPKAIYEPILPGQSAAVVPSFFDLVGMMKKNLGTKGLEVSVLTAGPSMFGVRDRTGSLGVDEKVDAKNPEKLWFKVRDNVKKLAAKP